MQNSYRDCQACSMIQWFVVITVCTCIKCAGTRTLSVMPCVILIAVLISFSAFEETSQYFPDCSRETVQSDRVCLKPYHYLNQYNYTCYKNQRLFGNYMRLYCQYDYLQL